MKKALCLILAVTMLFALAACGGGGGGTATNAPSVVLPTNDMPGNYNPAPTGSAGTQAPAAEGATGPQYGGVVKIIARGSTSSPFGFPWIPFIAVDWASPWTETLVLLTKDGEYEPHLAENWDIDTEAHTITFYLKQGIKFTDGSPFNAEAVAWNINRWPVDGKGNEEIIEDAWAEDEYTVVVPYENWQNVLFQTFASHTYSMISMQNVLDNGIEYAKQNPVGTGPFILSDWTPGAHIKFVRNENYWMEGKPYLDAVEYYEISDTMTQNAVMQTTSDDKVDMFVCSNAEQANTIIQSTAPFTQYMRPSIAMTLCPSSDNPDSPMSDLRVRQAIAYAIDREAIVEAMGFGILEVANQLTSAGFAGHLPDDNPNLVSYNPDKARQLLDEAGYGNGFTTTITSGARYKDVVQIIQLQLAEIGITCELEFPESGAMSDLQYNGWEGILAGEFGQHINTGIMFYIWYHPDQDTYVSAMRPDEYEAMYYEARRSFNIDNELFGRLGNLVLEYMTYIPVYYVNDVYFVREGLIDHGQYEYSVDTIWTPWNAYWAAGG